MYASGIRISPAKH